LCPSHGLGQLLKEDEEKKEGEQRKRQKENKKREPVALRFAK